MSRSTKRAATIAPRRNLAAMVAPLWALPALVVNVDWSAGILSPWNLAAAASIAGAALFAAAACQVRGWSTVLAFGIVAALLTANNTFTAFTSASHRSADGRDHRQSEIATIARLEKQRSQWSESRASAAMVAGETPQAALSMEVTSLVAANARRWASTNQCDPAAVTAPQSMQFCAAVAALRGKLAAASKRDGLDVRIEGVNRELATITAPASADPFADAIADVAAGVGLPLSEARAAALPAIRDGLRSFTLELVAALGPAAWLMLWKTSPSKSQTVRVVPGRPARKAAVPVSADNVVAFTGERVERDAGSNVRAGELWSAWRTWCASRSIDPGSQKVFGQAMAQQFKHDRNNGRPQYVGIRLRQKAAPARLVVPFKKRKAA